MTGVLLLRKPKGITSHDAVLRVRKMFHTKKVGHAGTLDPFATGLLVLCLGDATRIVQYLTECDKIYRAVMKLGERTDTQDETGHIIARRALPALTDEEMRRVFARFTGEIQQVTPMFSARRAQGKRLHELARAGQTVEREARPVTIHRLDLLDMTLPYMRFQVECSKGTYVRALADDIGETLGCGAHLTELERLGSGRFSLDAAVSLDALADLRDDAALRGCLLTMDQALADWPVITLDAAAAQRLCNGVALIESVADGGEGLLRAHDEQGAFIALARRNFSEGGAKIQPISVFVRNPANPA